MMNDDDDDDDDEGYIYIYSFLQTCQALALRVKKLLILN